MDDPVLLALRSALAAGESAALRVAVAKRLLELGRASDALADIEAALTLDPGSLDLLEAAASAADAAGDRNRAEAYRLAAAHRAADRAAPAVGPQAGGEAPHLRIVGPEDDNPPPAGKTITFADVGGLADLKLRLRRSLLLPLQQPELMAKYGKAFRGGLLLYGPPGCGKTFIARALAGELGARFVALGLTEVLDMWFGESERKLHEIFENARRQGPTVLFLDEVDAIGQRRTNLKHSPGRSLVTQLLSELDGLGADNRNLFVLGATNHPWDVDPALRRPGRFDRMLFVPPPDLEARESILDLAVRGRPVATVLDLRGAARRTDGFSGADLAAVANAAVDLAFERSVATGREVPVDDGLLRAALEDTRPSTRPWLETARNYAVYANEGGSYDDLLGYLRGAGMA